ncbi:hypothetical protein Pmani_025132 [Petrolisthes manimaculis]|uniref:Uncharacterized protein n=1 Tax=Petrolisthes manimaculis TaxID=1843537 RepID=A0AAE1P6R9_9EUCA|nr:hypothetical protein Pmani_025132 [Petrolisthes manimaculis]
MPIVEENYEGSSGGMEAAGAIELWGRSEQHEIRRSVDFATATAVCNYNVGYMESNITHLLGIEYTHAMDKYLKHKDETMDAPIKRKMRKVRIRKELEYAAGAF